MIYSLLWKAARPLLRKHKRLRDGFAERLVPQGWPFTPAMQAPALLNTGYGLEAAATAVKEPEAASGPLRPGFALNASAGNVSTGCGAGLEPGAASSSAYYCDLWIQAASGGESYLAWEILRLLAARGGGLRVLCTTCTRQGLEVLHKAQQELARASIEITVNFLPLDEPPLMRRAVAQAFGPRPSRRPDECRDECEGERRGEYGGKSAQNADFQTTGGNRVNLCDAAASENALAPAGGESAMFGAEGSGYTGMNAESTGGGNRANPRGTAGESHCPEGGEVEKSGANTGNHAARRACLTRGRVLVLLETEIWPGLLAACSEAGVEVLILNARMTEGSFKAYRFLAPFLRRNSPQGILATSRSDLERFCRVFDGRQAKSEKTALEVDFTARFSDGENLEDPETCPEPPGRGCRIQPPAGSGSGKPLCRGLMRNIKFDRVFLGGELKKKDPFKRPASGIAPYPPCAEHNEAESGLQPPTRHPGAESGWAPAQPGPQGREVSASAGNNCTGPAVAARAPVLFASVREEEEEQLLGVLAVLRESDPELPVIIAPRHMHRVPAWERALSKEFAPQEATAQSGLASGQPVLSKEAQCRENTATPEGQPEHAHTGQNTMPHLPDGGETGVSTTCLASEFSGCSKRSGCPDAPTALKLQPGEIRIWDAFGEMDLLYRNAGAVFVGGSLAPLGGQNFLEPLAVGVTPVIGPSWSNFYWAGTELFEKKLVRQVRNADELAPALLELARNPRPRAEVIREFNEYLAPRRGGTRQAVELILATLRGQQCGC